MNDAPYRGAGGRMGQDLVQGLPLPAPPPPPPPPPPAPAPPLLARPRANSTRTPTSQRPLTGRQSLRRVKDSREELRQQTTRARGLSTSTLERDSPSQARSFTVANVGTNGILYLRPSVRPGHTRQQSPEQHHFVFPQTPPDSATLHPRNASHTRREGHVDEPAARPTFPRKTHEKRPPTAADDAPKIGPAQVVTSPSRPIAHFRSRSFSTTQDGQTTVGTRDSTEPGTFKVVIERPPFHHTRPKTADTGTIPLLEVPIPHYRLGTPRFSTQGTVTLRSSVYTRASATDDLRSTIISPRREMASFLSSCPRSDVVTPTPANHGTPAIEPVPIQAVTIPVSARASKVPIGPHLFDALTANPDDRSVVRFSSSGEILAATPSRLIAHITSPSFLDYELLSDFFLTFRAFLSIKDLAAYLVSRLRWAVDRQDDFGRIVRVRTFVALRHWILNYFVDDFVPCFSLRVHFCDLVNALYGDLKARPNGGGGDLKIVGELKKCWRRTCALYWDSEDDIGKDMADDDILPGGTADARASYTDCGSIPPMPSTPPQQTSRPVKVDNTGSNPSDPSAGQHMEWTRKSRHTPQNSLSSPYNPSQEYDGGMPLSPSSTHSIHVLSCSIPVRGLGKPEPTSDMPLYPHPVPNLTQPRYAASPSSPSSNRRNHRPKHGHKRSGSFSDALRDQRAPLSIPKIVETDAAISAMANAPGTLIRGGIFQPGNPYLDTKDGALRHARSHLHLERVDSKGDDAYSNQASSPGVKKIFGTVRRALSSKQPSVSNPQLSGIGQHMSNASRSSNPASVSTSSGGVHKRRKSRPRPQVRVDLLASRVLESFQEAIKQQMKDGQDSSQITHQPDLSGFQFDFAKQQDIPSADVVGKPVSLTASQRKYSTITSGDRSIIIMDDTGVPELPMMSGALPSPPTTENIVAATTSISYHQREVSIDGRIAEEPIRRPPLSLYKNSEGDIASNPQRSSVRSSQRSVVPQRRSLSAGQERMHSFRRRGSSKKLSLAHTASLRRHASYNSGLSRRNTDASIATFHTMSSDNDPFFLDRHPTQNVGPARQLRRRPGGDLRAVDNVQDLEPMHRPHSTGSVSNRTHSISNSIILHSDRYVEPLTAATEPIKQGEFDDVDVPKKPISLVATHSSQPNLRPSFEAEVAKLAALPDDTDDDGGIESALMKLEGRYEKKTPEPSPRNTTVPEQAHVSSDPYAEFLNHDSSHISPQTGGSAPRPSLAPSLMENESLYAQLPGEDFRQEGRTENTADSEDSFTSTPLLDRDLSAFANSPRSKTFDSMRSSARPDPLKPNSPPSWFGQPPGPGVTSPDSSMEYVVETESMKRIPRNGTVPHRPSPPRESFLLDEEEDLSDDGNSVMVARSEGTSHGVRSFFDDEPAVVDSESDGFGIHPLRHPPTPPLTANRVKDQPPQASTTVFERGLPTPGLTPTSRFTTQPFGDNVLPPARATDPKFELKTLQRIETAPEAAPAPAHLPFVLAYDSEIIAQQLTIVEKDALDEIDWKELIELRWKQSSPSIRDWVSYLRTQDARGVDVVIARFNLVVKWVVSECLLTESLEERASCIVKFIHIASHCRRLRNYATMYQITIALLSADVSRLKKTWELVPGKEMQVLRGLEGLVQPLRNFHSLRVEMEGQGVEEGCIPFIGIYTRDLIYNAQKPAFIDSSSSPPRPDPINCGERLVNFERHHTAAMIVKSLLRLLEASSKYKFEPQPEVISKCLWLAALSDEDLTRLSRRYE